MKPWNGTGTHCTCPVVGVTFRVFPEGGGSGSSRLGFDPSTLALKGRNQHNESVPIFRDFFILSHSQTLHCIDPFHIDPDFWTQSSTNLAQSSIKTS